MSYVLSQFVKRVIEAFKEKFPKAIITQEKQKGESLSSSQLWQGLEEMFKQMQGSGSEAFIDKMWPCEV